MGSLVNANLSKLFSQESTSHKFEEAAAQKEKHCRKMALMVSVRRQTGTKCKNESVLTFRAKTSSLY